MPFLLHMSQKSVRGTIHGLLRSPHIYDTCAEGKAFQAANDHMLVIFCLTTVCLSEERSVGDVGKETDSRFESDICFGFVVFSKYMADDDNLVPEEALLLESTC